MAMLCPTAHSFPGRPGKPPPLLVQGGRLSGGLGELADTVLDAADEIARGEGDDGFPRNG